MTAATYDGDGLRASLQHHSGGGPRTTPGTRRGPYPQLLMDSTNAYIYAGGTAPAEQVNLTTGSGHLPGHRLPRLRPRHRQQPPAP